MLQDTRQNLRDPFERRLGQALLSRDLITQRQLEDGLRRQVVQGAHLGTNLWEIDAIGLPALGQVSGELLGMPVADERTVAKISEKLKTLLPPRFVIQSRILPISLEGRNLRVATSEPWDLMALEEAVHRSNLRVQTFFLPEVLAMRLIEHLYGVSVGPRFALKPDERPIVEEVVEPAAPRAPDLMPEHTFDQIYRSGDPEAQPAAAPLSEATPQAPAPPLAPPQLAQTPPPVAPTPAPPPSPAVAQPPMTRPPVAPVAPPPTTPPPVAPGALPTEDGGSVRVSPPPTPPPTIDPSLPVMDPRDLAPAAVSVEAPIDDLDFEVVEIDIQAPEPEPVRVLEPIETLGEAIQALQEAGNRDGLGEVLMRFAKARAPRTVLLTRDGDIWRGWMGAGEGIDPAAIHGLSVPSEPGTLFGVVGATGGQYLGPVASHPVHTAFLDTLGGAVPTTAVLLPVHYGGRVVFGMYLDAGHNKMVSPDVGELLVIAQRVPMTLERLVRARLGQA